MDTVFRIENRTLQTENYMLANWGTVKQKGVSKWIEVLKQDGCLFDQFNLSRSGKFLKNSISIELWDRIRTEVSEEEPSGPEVFTAIVLSYQVTSSTVVQALVEELKTLRIRKIPGENVETLTKLVVDKAQRITGTGKQPDNFNMIIATCFLDSRSKQFEALANQLHGQADDDDTEMDWKRDIVHPLRKKYVSLKAQGLWPTTISQSSEIQGLQAKILALEAKFENSDQSHANSNGTSLKREPTCWKCGETGHTKFNCPKSDVNSSSSQDKTPATTTGTKVPPKDGESQTRTRDGILEKWCRRCRRWTKGAKAHLTEEHVSNKGKSESQANVGVTDDVGTDYEEQSFMTTRLYKAVTSTSAVDDVIWCEECDSFKLKSHSCKYCNYPKGSAGQC
jgi:ribosomal protein L32